MGLAFATLTLMAAIVIGVNLSKQSGIGVPNIVQRQVTANPVNDSVYNAAISADSKYLAYADLRGVHIQVFDTGEVYNVPLSQDLCFR